MAVLNIRNLPDDVHSRLRLRAAQAHRSMEAEARAILAEVCGKDPPAPDPRSLQQWVDELYGPERPSGVVEELLAERRLEGSSE